jgi:hypothetical protein
MIISVFQWLIKLIENNPRIILIPLLLDVLFFYGGFQLYAKADDVESRMQGVELVMEGHDSDHTKGIRDNGIAVKEAVRSIKSYALEQQIITMESEASGLERAERRGDLLEGDGARLDILKARINQIHRELEKVRTAHAARGLSWVG